MNQPSSPDPRQRANIHDSLVKGQVGQARRDLWQFQFLFGGEATKAKREQQNRQALISKVRNFWIKGVLEKSLQSQSVIELGLEKRSDAVEQAFNIDWVSSSRRVQSMPEGTKATDLFTQMGEGGTLLILGEPGSGKTIMLLELARNLLDRAEQEKSQPIPVVFNLSSWRGNAIAEWLAQELEEKYQVSKILGRNLIENQQLTLLLDGLDEVRIDLRDASILALNKFVQEYGKTEVIICSRVKDYESLSQRLKLQGAIMIKPLTSDQVYEHLSEIDKNKIGLKETIQSDSILRNLISTPLMLSILSFAYQEISTQSLSQLNSREEYLKYLFNAYSERMLFRRQAGKQVYLRENTKHWLSWLATKMIQENQSIFLIERIQPLQLETQKQRKLYILSLNLIIRLLIALIFALLLGTITAVISLKYGSYIALTSVKFAIIIGGIIGFLAGGLGQITKELDLLNLEIKLVESIDWKAGLLFSAYQGFIAALACLLLGPIVFLVSTFIGKPIPVSALPFAVILTFIIESGRSLSRVVFEKENRDQLIFELETKAYPNQGIFKSFKNSLIWGIICTIVFSLLSVFPFAGAFSELKLKGFEIVIFCLVSGLAIGIFPALFLGGITCIKHFTLRCILYHNKRIPWDYTHFLDYAVERIFLQKVGGGYIFIHRLLLEHFAQMNAKG